MQIIKFRPQFLDEFVGKPEVVETLRIYLQAALNNNDVLDHILFYGLAGVGKTSLATIIANELNTKIHFVQGSNLKKSADLLNVFSLVNEGEVVFIDEIHSVHPSCIEMLYLILEDFVIDISIGLDNNTKQMRMKLPKFCLIASTNQLYKLPNPLIDRFSIQLFIDEYAETDLAQILLHVCEWNEIVINPEVAKTLAQYAKGIPRIGINHLKKFLAYQQYYQDLSESEIIKKMELVQYGLNEIDLKYLRFLKDSAKPIGLKTISQYLGLDLNTVELKIESYLVKQGLIRKTNKGRLLTKQAFDFLASMK